MVIPDPQVPDRRHSRRRTLVVVAGIVVVFVGLGWLIGARKPTVDLAGAPGVTLLYFDGSTERLADLVGQPVVLNFWASWCPACISEMPAFAEVHRRFGDRVRFIGVNMQEMDLDAAIALADRTGVEYPLAHDPDGKIFVEFGGLAMPTTVFISADGSIALVHSGAMFSDDLASIIEGDLLG
jgi:thiol-disulfide isomerase/thioredoxin